jgi:hypothetical protein
MAPMLWETFTLCREKVSLDNLHTCQQVSWLTQLYSARSAQSIPLSRAQLVSLQAKLSGRLELTQSAHSAQLIGAVGILRRMVLVEEGSHDFFLVLSS